MLPLEDLEEKFGSLTDKFSNGYMRPYLDLAEELGPAARVLEVGVWKGGSLKLWQYLFPKGVIAGVDNHWDGVSVFPAGAHEILLSQDNPYLPEKAIAISPEGWDLIIDDASHKGSLSQKTFDLLWPLVRPGGWYALEDWTVGVQGSREYPRYEGDSMLRLAQSFVERIGWQHNDISELRYVRGLALVRKVTNG